RPTQLWLDPADITPQALPSLVASVHPCEHILILGGTTVHDWFNHHNAIDRLFLTVEPLTFGSGLPMFSGQAGDPCATLERMGYACISETNLNATGTRYLEFRPR
ncbi:MAG: dihydrofolate reductase family protein, partial [Pseudomonadota bacterium]